MLKSISARCYIVDNSMKPFLYKGYILYKKNLIKFTCTILEKNRPRMDTI